MKITLPERRDILKIGKHTISRLINPSSEIECSVSKLSGSRTLFKAVAENQKVFGFQKSHNGDFPDEVDEVFRLPSSQRGSSFPTSGYLPLKDLKKSRGIDEVVNSWEECFRFQSEDDESETLGLREPQLGALHAICARLSLDPEPMTVVLPTGVGKTETMLAVAVQQKLARILVLVPSDVLRSQLAGKFETLGRLKEIGVVSEDALVPWVCALKTGLRSVDEAKKLTGSSNVIVATASILNASNPGAVSHLAEACDLLFVDEAHHIQATTWNEVKNHFVDQKKPVIQFTATPFRNDKKQLGAPIIYNYPLKKAQENRYFKKLTLEGISEPLPQNADLKIAEKAVQVLRRDLERFDHRLLARTARMEKAEEVIEHYRQLAPDLNPVVIHSKLSKGEQEAALKALFSGHSKICVCVSMLGEGFDFPNLKVAAIHDEHKSLPVFLQFIGRITRQDRSLGDATVVANLADPKVEGAMNSLYAQDADWNDLLRVQSEERIEYEEQREELINGFKETSDLHKVPSLWNLRPSYSAFVFKSTHSANLSPQNVEEKLRETLPNNCVFKASVNSQKQMIVCVAEKNDEVKWGKFQGIRNHDLELLVIRYDDESQTTYFSASDFDFFRADKLIPLLFGSSYRIDQEKVLRVFSNIDYPMIRNLGARKTGEISFAMYFGSSVLEPLSSVEQQTSVLSNLAGWGYEDGERASWGCSYRKGKIWSKGGGNLHDWTEWTKKVWSKIGDDSLETAQILANFLRAEAMEGARHQSVPITAQWGDRIITAKEDTYSLFFGRRGDFIGDVSLSIIDGSETGDFTLEFWSETLGKRSRYIVKFEIGDDGLVTVQYEHDQGELLKIGRTEEVALDLTTWMNDDPIVIRYADGAQSANQRVIKLKNSTGQIGLNSLSPLDWLSNGVDIKNESMGRDGDSESIQQFCYKNFRDDFDIIFNDDGSGEMADLVGLKFNSEKNQVEVTLVHCKFSSSSQPGARLKDFYEVCGQAQRSTAWKHKGFVEIVKHLQRRDFRWKENGSSRILKGTHQELIDLKQIARKSRLIFEILVVQPGLSKAQVTPEILKLLGATEDYIQRTSGAELTIYCSA